MYDRPRLRQRWSKCFAATQDLYSKPGIVRFEANQYRVKKAYQNIMSTSFITLGVKEIATFSPKEDKKWSN